MSIAEKLSPEAERSVEEIVREDLKDLLGEGLAISGVRITPGEDRYGDPYHHIVVIYTGDGGGLDAAWLNGFKRRNREALAKWGIDMTTESYVEETEDSEWSEPASLNTDQGSHE